MRWSVQLFSPRDFWAIQVRAGDGPWRTFATCENGAWIFPRVNELDLTLGITADLWDEGPKLAVYSLPEVEVKEVPPFWAGIED